MLQITRYGVLRFCSLMESLKTCHAASESILYSAFILATNMLSILPMKSSAGVYERLFENAQKILTRSHPPVFGSAKHYT